MMYGVFDAILWIIPKVGGGLHHSLSPERTQHPQPGQSGASWLASQRELPGGAQHLQYNTPIGLYSKASAQEAVYGSSTSVKLCYVFLCILCLCFFVPFYVTIKLLQKDFRDSGESKISGT